MKYTPVFIVALLYGLIQVAVQQEVVHTIQVCENATPATIVCPQAINIVSAFFGRLDRTICPTTGTSNTNCAQASATNTVYILCNGKPKCTVAATDAQFGDPCVGTPKYMVIKYTCPSLVTAQACENAAAVQVSCPAGQTLNIVSALYGRMSTTVCPAAASSMSNTNCAQATALSTVQRICAGKNQCSVAPTNAVFGDPCVGTNKYLQIAYYCTVMSSGLVCENTPAVSLTCASNQVVTVVSAFFGRADKTTCPGDETAKAVSNSSCIQPSATKTASNLCYGKSQCSIAPTDSVFGDPCVGTFKYMTLNYYCAAVTSVVACENTAAVSLTCSGDQFVNIVSVLYGRTDKTTCPTTATVSTSCSQAKALSIVQGLCAGKSQCSVAPTNAQFTDPCVGTPKYLNIQYFCSA